MKTIALSLIAASLLAASARAQTSLAVSSARGYPGQTATLPFTVRKATNIVAAQFDLAYNTAKGALGDPALSSRYTNHVIRSREIAPGVRRVLVYSRSNALLRTNGFSGSLTFDVPAAERVGSGSIAPQNVVLARADATAIAPVSATPGKVFVTQVYRDPASGVVDFFLPSEPDQQYVIEATTNLVDWVNISTNVATGAFMDLMDNEAPPYPYRFYRWRREP